MLQLRAFALPELRSRLFGLDSFDLHTFALLVQGVPGRYTTYGPGLVLPCPAKQQFFSSFEASLECFPVVLVDCKAPIPALLLELVEVGSAAIVLRWMANKSLSGDMLNEFLTFRLSEEVGWQSITADDLESSSIRPLRAGNCPFVG